MWNISHYKGKGNRTLQGERYKWVSKPFLLFSIKGKVLCNWFQSMFPFPFVLQCEWFGIICVPFPVLVPVPLGFCLNKTLMRVESDLLFTNGQLWVLLMTRLHCCSRTLIPLRIRREMGSESESVASNVNEP